MIKPILITSTLILSFSRAQCTCYPRRVFQHRSSFTRACLYSSQAVSYVKLNSRHKRIVKLSAFETSRTDDGITLLNINLKSLNAMQNIKKKISGQIYLTNTEWILKYILKRIKQVARISDTYIALVTAGVPNSNSTIYQTPNKATFCGAFHSEHNLFHCSLFSLCL